MVVVGAAGGGTVAVAEGAVEATVVAVGAVDVAAVAEVEAVAALEVVEAAVGVVGVVEAGTLVVGSAGVLRWTAGAILEGRVLLRWTPVNEEGVLGLRAAFEAREFLEDTETFRRILPYLRKLSVPPLALETERRILVCVVVGARGARPPDSTALTVSGSAAVPFIPNKK